MWLTTCSRAEPVSVLAGCGYPCRERGGHVAKTSGHTLSVSLTPSHSFLTAGPPCGLPFISLSVIEELRACPCGLWSSSQKSLPYILHLLCLSVVSFSVQGFSSSLHVKLSFLTFISGFRRDPQIFCTPRRLMGKLNE